MDMLTYAEIKPAVNEVELHPYNVQKGLVNFLDKYDILPIGYCPLARSGKDQGIHADETISELAKKYDKTNAQICLRWGLDRGYPVIPKSSNFERLRENFDILDFTLEQGDIEKLSSLDKRDRVCYGERLPFVLNNDIFA